MPAECPFCRISAGEIPADIVHEDDLVVAFRDIEPRAPTHVLVVPREHLDSAADLDDGHDSLLGRIVAVANRVAAAEGIAETGYRLVTNVGPDGGQSVRHLHLHLLGGRPMTRLG
jgi:histidine triad (HIT) family protein